MKSNIVLKLELVVVERGAYNAVLIPGWNQSGGSGILAIRRFDERGAKWKTV
jgi:hypothetical protein